MKKTIKIIFTISIILNVVLVGIICGGVYKKSQHHRSLSDFTQMSNAAKEALKENMKSSRSILMDHSDTMHKYHEDLKNIMQAAEFDLKAYQKIMDFILQDKNQMEIERAQAMGGLLTTLSQEDRMQIYTHMKKKGGASGRGEFRRKGDKERRPKPEF